MSDGAADSRLLALTAQIVSAHAANNAVQQDQLIDMITKVYATLSGATAEPAVVEAPKPAVAIKQSVFPDYIVCLEDGKKLKMLKRHLQATYDMTPDQYRARWGLPSSYPMVAPNYAKHRSSLAKKIGLGRKPAPAVEVEAPAKRVGRPRKVKQPA